MASASHKSPVNLQHVIHLVFMSSFQYVLRKLTTGTITEPQAELFELIVEGGVEFDDEFWSHVSETAKVCGATLRGFVFDKLAQKKRWCFNGPNHTHKAIKDIRKAG